MIDDLSKDYQDLTDRIGEKWAELQTVQKLALKAVLDQAKAVIEGKVLLAERRKIERRGTHV